MKNLFSIIMIVATGAVAIALNLPIFGKWTKEIHLNDAIYWFSLDIKETSTVFTMKCESEGEVGEVSMELPTRVSGTTYEVLETGSKGTDVGDIDCRVFFPADKLTYDTTDTQLKLVTSGNDPIFFNRVE